MTASSGASDPNHAEDVLDDVRKAIAPDDRVLKEARKRRDVAKKAALQFRGSLRAFNSGSVAHGTANDPISDADCGVVLDRRHHTTVGPHGDGPVDVVEEMVEFIEPLVKAAYPMAKVTTTKRAVLVEVNEPIDDEDPSVDLIVGLNRAEDDALLIPHLDADRWNPSHPEKHTALLAGKPDDLRVHRARVLRLAKAAVKNDGDKAVMCSFNIEALALEHVADASATLAASLHKLFERSARSIRTRLTPDPAGVSPPIKLPSGVSQESAARRLEFFASKVKEAMEAPDRAAALAALAEIYGPQLPDAPKSSKAMLADELRRNERGAATVGAFGVTAGTLRTVRSFGSRG